MILKFRNTLKEWRSLYTDAIKNRLRRDLNLSDVFNVQTTRDNIGLSGDNNHTHYHDDRYMPVISRGDATEAKSRTDADDKLSKKIDKVIVDYQNADTYTYNTRMNEIDKLRKNIENNIQKQIDVVSTDINNTNDTINNMFANLRNCKLKIITGIAYHNDILPVPNGSLRSNCKYLVSLNRWTNTHSDNKYAYEMYINVDESTGKLTCYTVTSGRNGSGGTYPGYANYIVVDMSSIGI